MSGTVYTLPASGTVPLVISTQLPGTTISLSRTVYNLPANGATSTGSAWNGSGSSQFVGSACEKGKSLWVEVSALVLCLVQTILTI